MVFWSVVHRIVAVVPVTGHEATLVITGAGDEVVEVVKVRFADVVDMAEPLADMTA